MRNCVMTISPDIACLTALKVLDVRLPPTLQPSFNPVAQLQDNWLSALPREIGRLCALETLLVSPLLDLQPERSPRHSSATTS